MKILLNHSISGAADVIDMIRDAHPEVTIIATHERTDTPIKQAADRFLPEPKRGRKMSAENYANWLLQTALDEGADVVIPYLRRQDLSAYRSRFADNGIRLVVAGDIATMILLEDKPVFLTEMEDVGIPITPFVTFTGPDAYAALRADPTLLGGYKGTLCVKPTSGIYASGFRIIRDSLEPWETLSLLGGREIFSSAFQDLLTRIEKQEELMLMPFFPGIERSVDFACFEGRMLGSVTRIKSDTSQRILHDDIGESLAIMIAERFKLTGVLNLQTVEDSSGVQHLLEANSRAAGGIGMTGLSNVNLPGLLISAIKGDFPPRTQRVEREIRVGQRTLYSVM
ncbi:MAG: ATP-grasp domain-containing protein [Roseibium sp.]|uniref:ATP-grasp domain-containing protein n=1 Tax=Roseibium sp. TaxID=1936156 RepID=UPI003299E546